MSQKNKFCIDCNKSIWSKSIRCLPCANSFHKKGSHLSEEAKQKVSLAQKGKKKSEEHKKNIGLALKGKMSNQAHPCWKGDKVGYNALHTWIRKNKSKPKLCEECKVKPPKDVANISGLYKRDINDFEWICRKCHFNGDGRLLKFQEGLKKWKLSP